MRLSVIGTDRDVIGGHRFLSAMNIINLNTCIFLVCCCFYAFAVGPAAQKTWQTTINSWSMNKYRLFRILCFA